MKSWEKLRKCKFNLQFRTMKDFEDHWQLGLIPPMGYFL